MQKHREEFSGKWPFCHSLLMWDKPHFNRQWLDHWPDAGSNLQQAIMPRSGNAAFNSKETSG